MDNLCHTLVGAAFGEAGLKQKTRFGNATLMIAANLPDVDVLVFATYTPSVVFRRGWTHGIVAQLLLPIVLTAAMATLGRSGRTRRDGPPLSIPWLLGLSYIGVYSHVFLDYLNNYGVRLLAPIDWRWIYGDTLFIVDPWLWMVLGVGVWLARRRQSLRPAHVSLAIAACYVAVMLVGARASRDIVADAWRSAHGTLPSALMVGPVPITPFVRDIVIDAGDHYETGRFSWAGRSVTLDPMTVPKNSANPAVADARRSVAFRAFLVWSRFPYFAVEPASEGTRVTVRDMRFGGAIGGRFAVSVITKRAPSTF